MPEAGKTDVVVIGAMKAASSTINAYLEDHPEIFMVANCEPNYFSHDENYEKGPDWYASFFEKRTSERLCGEGSNHYSARDLYPESAARMAAHNPKIKIIYMVRHPLDRIVSAWIQNRADDPNRTPATLDDAVIELPDHFIGQSRYWHNIAPYREFFDDDQIFVGFMEDLRSDPANFFASLSAFLDTSASTQAKRPHQNKSAGKRLPTPAFDKLQKSPLNGYAKSFLPKGLRKFVKERMLSKPLIEKPCFSPEVQVGIVDILKPDAEAFLEHYGKPDDFWIFE